MRHTFAISVNHKNQLINFGSRTQATQMLSIRMNTKQRLQHSYRTVVILLLKRTKSPRN